MINKIKFENLEWEVFEYGTNFNEVSGIYIITDINKNIVYIGQTSNLKERHSNHHQEGCFNKNNARYIYISRENSEKKRFEIETYLINKYNTVCNKI